MKFNLVFPLILSVCFAAVHEVLVTKSGFQIATLSVREGDSLIIRGSGDLDKYNVRQVQTTSECGPKSGQLTIDSPELSAGQIAYTAFDNPGSYVFASGKDANFCSYLTVQVEALPDWGTEFDLQAIGQLLRERGSAFGTHLSSMLALLTVMLFLA